MIFRDYVQSEEMGAVCVKYMVNEGRGGWCEGEVAKAGGGGWDGEKGMMDIMASALRTMKGVVVYVYSKEMRRCTRAMHGDKRVRRLVRRGDVLFMLGRWTGYCPIERMTATLTSVLPRLIAFQRGPPAGILYRLHAHIVEQIWCG